MRKSYKSMLTRSRLHLLAVAFRQQTGRWLDERMAHYLRVLEEAFYSAADQEQSCRVRQEYLDAARTLQKQGREVQALFRANMLKSVETFFLHYEVYLEEFIHGFTSPAVADSLELVRKEKLEEDLVVLRIAHRASSMLQATHLKMAAYLEAVVHPKNLPREGAPLSPQVIAGCLRMALVSWPGSARTRLLFYEVLLKEVIAHLGDLHPPLIETLRKAGVEPMEMPVQLRAVGKSPARAPTQPRRQVASRREETAFFSMIKMVGRIDAATRDRLGMVALDVGAAPVSGQVMSTEMLVEVVQALEVGTATTAREETLDEVKARRHQWKQEVASRLQQEMKNRSLRLNRLDQRIFDVMTLLFDFVLEDNLIPNSMKVQLVRLQVPMFKVAIGDKTFFADQRHPARRLLNNLFRAAVRWVPREGGGEDCVYGMIRCVVETVATEKQVDRGLFERMNRRFEAFLARQERGARVTEERVAQVARGREQLTLARKRVAEVLHEPLAQAVPDVVRAILEDAWRDVLTLVLLREGEESDAWREARDVVRVLTLVGRGDAVRLGRAFDEALEKLRRGFSCIAYDSRKSDQLLEELESYKYKTNLVAETESGMEQQTKPLSAPVMKGCPNRMADAHDRLVKQLVEGVWVRWETPDGGERRGKLAWRSDLADIYLFVDTRGRKVAEHTSGDLAELFRRGRAMVLEQIDRPFMERALDHLHRLIDPRSGGASPQLQLA